MREPYRIQGHPAAVEAMPYDGGNRRDIYDWMKSEAMKGTFHVDGTLTLSPGDWVLKTASGRFFSCSPDDCDFPRMDPQAGDAVVLRADGRRGLLEETAGVYAIVGLADGGALVCLISELDRR